MSQNELRSIIYITIIIVISLAALTLLIYVAYRILRSPFHYPYFTHTFDVSRKRNVDIADYIDRFLCDDINWNDVHEHKERIDQWKRIRSSIYRRAPSESVEQDSTERPSMMKGHLNS